MSIAYGPRRGRSRKAPPVPAHKAGLKAGDVIEITNISNGKVTAGLLYPGKNEDKGSNSIRIDSSLRRNLNAILDDFVEIRTVIDSLAEKVT